RRGSIRRRAGVGADRRVPAAPGQSVGDGLARAGARRERAGAASGRTRAVNGLSFSLKLNKGARRLMLFPSLVLGEGKPTAGRKDGGIFRQGARLRADGRARGEGSGTGFLPPSS